MTPGEISVGLGPLFGVRFLASTTSIMVVNMIMETNGGKIYFINRSPFFDPELFVHLKSLISTKCIIVKKILGCEVNKRARCGNLSLQLVDSGIGPERLLLDKSNVNKPLMCPNDGGYIMIDIHRLSLEYLPRSDYGTILMDLSSPKHSGMGPVRRFVWRYCKLLKSPMAEGIIPLTLQSWARKNLRDVDKFPIEPGRIPLSGLAEICSSSRNRQLANEEMNSSS
ncbi:BTB/POZ/Kelch-associated protein [Striga asiatica]|uniref:BTB/POZ/Kelch-associated protein n=1 Tax=Striga asiatica TaxID=4170 RepID=A0A5A7PSI9_STRAF|nr:BTB/POZ/Kelch-associated protein [Striga asiatica]